MATTDSYRYPSYFELELTGLNVKVNEAVFKGRMSTVWGEISNTPVVSKNGNGNMRVIWEPNSYTPPPPPQFPRLCRCIRLTVARSPFSQIIMITRSQYFIRFYPPLPFNQLHVTLPFVWFVIFKVYKKIKVEKFEKSFKTKCSCQRLQKAFCFAATEKLARSITSSSIYRKGGGCAWERRIHDPALLTWKSSSSH